MKGQWVVDPNCASSTLPIRGKVWGVIYIDDDNRKTMGYWYSTPDEAEAQVKLLNIAEERESPCLHMCPHCRYRRVHRWKSGGICNYCGYYDIGGQEIFVMRDNEGNAQITIYDHCKITIKGIRGKNPTIIVDSNEYPTHLKVAQTKRRWESIELLPTEAIETHNKGDN